ncbi:Far upstream element-binding protein 3 [Desmophyllum pertusum]|uniref:Far upstream element-binding protein 3 n=1 Tax=Desmophyllum pertusum TaxID=174260 RepID=A0A9W9Y8Q5_9CNID|nr:Far upstream element-binding protein 3 [Desmophyllum pertusum]
MTEEAHELVAVPGDLMGFVIGKKGSTIKQIQTKSGAKLISDRDHRGFIVSGDEEQRACARQLVNEKVAEAQMINRRKRFPGQLVEIPSAFERQVTGKGGDNLKNISTLTGARVFSRGNQLYELRGTEKGVQHAELLLKRRVASARLKTDTICCYIDDRNLPEGCELKLVPVEEKERMMLPGSQSQYRLRPSEEYELGADSQGDNIPCYQADLIANALACLRKIKHDIESNKFQEADMWCHIGRVIIREPDEADVDEVWNIGEVVDKLQNTARGKKSDWRIAFKEGVEIDKKVLQETFSSQPAEEDYRERYDLSFLTPQGRSIRCKVWVANKGVQKKLEEIPIPFSDVKNVVEELHFEDGLTESRCRGWLVLSSQKYLQADIIFPGCKVDCRIMIRPLANNATQSSRHEDETKLLAGYLSMLTFSEADGLHLPDEKLPEGFLFNHMRCSRRTMYAPGEGFTLIVSEESTWGSDVKGEQNTETTDLHLGCEEWDRVLSGEDWEPEMIIAKLPKFLQFVHQVQDFLSYNNCAV